MLLDLLHEAVFVPELWPKALDALADLAVCQKAFLRLSSGRGFRRYIANSAAEGAAKSFAAGGWAKRDPQSERIVRVNEPRFVVDHDLFSDEEMNANPYYSGYLTAEGIRWGTSTYIASPGGAAVILSVHRAAERGPVPLETAERLTLLRPHIARCTMTAIRLKLQESQVELDLLERMGYPAAALEPGGRLRLANRLFGPVTPSVAEDRGDRLRFRSRAADGALARVLNGEDAFGASFGVPGREQTGPFIAHIFPVSGAARDIFSICRWILLLSPIVSKGKIDPATIGGLYDFTPAEAKVAAQIVSGRSLDDIARQSGRSIDTVRAQLKTVLAKSGVARQAELVGLLAPARLAVGGKA
jgi:DNA-binding CsgD family transcriptional regulator